MIRLSATIITLNEEINLARCLDSLSGLAGEIIVVDSGSKDKTVEIAKKYGAKVFHRDFDNFANQKNWATFKASGEWILSIDADEEISPQLSKEILQAIKSSEYNGFFIPRRNFILGAEIKHSRWSPDTHIWLWKKNVGKWQGDVHEEVVVVGKIGELRAGKIHHQDGTIGGFLVTNRKYARLTAQEILRKRGKFSLINLFWDPIFEFSIRFIYKKGFLDGWRGLVLALAMAFYKIDVWLQVLKLEFEKK